jgi:hypothetical protein
MSFCMAIGTMNKLDHGTCTHCTPLYQRFDSGTMAAAIQPLSTQQRIDIARSTSLHRQSHPHSNCYKCRSQQFTMAPSKYCTLKSPHPTILQAFSIPRATFKSTNTKQAIHDVSSNNILQTNRVWTSIHYIHTQSV